MPPNFIINPKPRRHQKIVVKVFVALFILLFIFTIWLGNFFSSVFLNTRAECSEQVFEITEGQSVFEIADNLQVAELIKDVDYFRLYLWLRGWENQIKAGEYQLDKCLRAADLAEILVAGETLSREREITIIEGWRLEETAAYLANEGVVSEEEFLAEVKQVDKYRRDYSFLGDASSLEGYLFPDTYRIFKDARAEDIIRRMLDNLDHKLTPELRLEISAQGKDISEILILASIVEKEVRSFEDQAMAADVFYKRLEVGMPLQSDATVNYITGKGTVRPSYDDLRVNSLYNTYQYRGLPPGPICSPGFSAIQAAIYPMSNEYWYFLTTEEGQVIYSRTGEEHNQNKARYLK